MRFQLTLNSLLPGQKIGFNYQYPLSAAIYKIINRADGAYAEFLHDCGYKQGNKTFKLFTFSDIRTPFKIEKDRLVMTTTTAAFTICFHVPDAAENFIKGLFADQQIEIADAKDKAIFKVEQVVAEKNPSLEGAILLHPLSPVVTGRKNERGNYDYIGPGECDFEIILINNLAEKYAAVHECAEAELQQLKKSISLETVLFNHPARHRLLTIKAGTAAETKVRGYDKFRLLVNGPPSIKEIALNAGLGMHNAMGMGCVEIIG